MNKFKVATTLTIALVMLLVGVNVNGATDIDAIARSYGYPTVGELLAVPGLSLTPQWEQDVQGYNSYDNTNPIYNSLFFATPSTASKIASWFGGEVIPQSSYTGGPYTIPTGATIKVGSQYINAGMAAKKLERLQNTYRDSVSNYKFNLESNPAIFESGNMPIPVDPMLDLKKYYGISGGSSGSTNSSLSRTGGGCVGRECYSSLGGSGSTGSTGSTVGNTSGGSQVNSVTTAYVRSIAKLIDNLLINARAKFGFSVGNTSSIVQQNVNATQKSSDLQKGLTNTTNLPNSSQNNANTIDTSGLKKCTGDIYLDLSAAQACAALTQSQAISLGYNASCSASKVGFPFTDSSGRNYYITATCTINGSKGHGASLLSGYDPGNSGYVRINSRWDLIEYLK